MVWRERAGFWQPPDTQRTRRWSEIRTRFVGAPSSLYDIVYIESSQRCTRSCSVQLQTLITLRSARESNIICVRGNNREKMAHMSIRPACSGFQLENPGGSEH